MSAKFTELTLTESVLRAQQHYYGKSRPGAVASEPDRLTADELGFIQSRDSFYLSTISENGWPYIQHRGGPPGFLRVLSPTSLAFADYQGNRQLLSTGNLTTNNRVALFLMDYPQRTRLKILGQGQVKDARDHPEIAAQLAGPTIQSVVERLFFIEVVSFDWNCPQHITPRYTLAEVEAIIAPLQHRIDELEAQLKSKS